MSKVTVIGTLTITGPVVIDTETGNCDFPTRPSFMSRSEAIVDPARNYSKAQVNAWGFDALEVLARTIVDSIIAARTKAGEPPLPVSFGQSGEGVSA